MSRTRRRSPLDRCIDVLVDPARRFVVFAIIAYPVGLTGIGLAVVGEPTNPETQLGTIGIVLMGASFCCLFIASVTAISLRTDEHPS